jgi:hypothetical protein
MQNLTNISIIQKEDILPLETYIAKLNTFSQPSPIIEDYIKFLYHNNIDFSFKPIASFDTFPSKHYSSLFILANIQKRKNGGHIVFDNSSHLNYAKLYLHSYVGKPTSHLQSLLEALPTPSQQDFFSFYRKKGFFILNSDEKYFYHHLKLLIEEPHRDTISSLVKNINLNTIDFSYLIQYKNHLFETHVQETIYQAFNAKLSSFENNLFVDPKIKNTLNLRSKIFLLKLGTEILFHEKPKYDFNLIQDYQDILSFSYVYQFFKKNKHPSIQPFFQHYQSFLHSSNKNLISIEEKFFFQKKYQISLSHLLQKNHISFIDSKAFLQKIHQFFQSQKELTDCQLEIQEQNNMIIFSLSSLDSSFLDLCKDFLNMILNDKKLFTNSNIYSNLFQKTILEKSLPILQQKIQKIKI